MQIHRNAFKTGSGTELEYGVAISTVFISLFPLLILFHLDTLLSESRHLAGLRIKSQDPGMLAHGLR